MTLAKRNIDKSYSLALATLLSATFMGIIDTSIINVAAPSIQHTLPASFVQIQLIIAGYIIAYGVGLVMGGRLGDTYGRKYIFQIGLFLFIISSLACALSTNAPLLIITRVIQGLSGALMLPQVLSIIQVLFSGRARSKALGYYGATIGLASIAGQVAGGLLISANPFNLSWRWVFLVNIPIGIIAFATSFFAIPESKSDLPKKIDIGGGVLLAVMLASLLYPLIMVSHTGWSGMFSILILVCLLSATLFIKWEQRIEREAREPLVRLTLFNQSAFRTGMLIVLAFYGGNAGFYLILSYFFQSGLHLSPLISGIGYAPLGVGFMVTSLISKRLVERFGMATLLSGTALMTLSFIVLALQCKASTTVLNLSPALFVSGAGEGLVAVTIIEKILAGVRNNIAGLASGALLTMTQIANVLSVVLTGGLFSVLSADSRDLSYVSAFIGCLIWLCGLTLLTALLLSHLKKIEKGKEEALHGE